MMHQYKTTSKNNNKNRNRDKMKLLIDRLMRRIARMLDSVQRPLRGRAKANSPEDALGAASLRVATPGVAETDPREPWPVSLGAGTEPLGEVAARGRPDVDREEPALWWLRRLAEFPGDDYPKARSRSSMRSGATKWVLYALRNGLDPSRRDWDAVEQMLASSGLSFATKHSYRSHIRRWFEWCDRQRDQWDTMPEAA